MRRSAFLGMALLASGCTGAGDFVSDTFNPYANPNRPLGDSETLHRVNGEALDAKPLLPEPGNVWPGPVKLQPSLQDVMQQGSPGAGGLPPPNVPPEGPRQALPPGMSPETNFPALPKANVPLAPPPTPGNPLSRAPQLPAGNLSTQPITIDNGNGTSTIIKPDGTIQTVPNKP